MGQKVIFPRIFLPPFQRRTNFAVGRLILTEDNGADNEDGGALPENGAARNGFPAAAAAAAVNWHFVDLTASDAGKRPANGEKYTQSKGCPSAIAFKS